MTGICGWFDAEGTRSFEPKVIDAMAAALGRFDASRARTAWARYGAVACAALMEGADVYSGERLLVAVWGQPRFPQGGELAALAEREGVACAVGRGYASTGSGVIAQLSGAFALAILDGAGNAAVLAVDRLGTLPLCYSTKGRVLVFGSTLASLGACPALDPRVDQQAIFDYLYFHVLPAPRTIYQGISRLEPGCCLEWRDGMPQARRYWRLHFVENEERPYPQLKEEFRDLLHESVRSAVANRSVGAFLSGGTDSSTIAGLIGAVTGEPARTYSIGFEAEGYDEMGYARIAARHFGTKHHEYYVTPQDVVSAIPQIAAVHDQPFGNSSAIPTYYCAKLAKANGVQTLLGGDGGDELFGGNARYATQYLYSLYGELPQTLRTRLIEPLAFGLPGGVSLVGKVQRYMRHACQPMPSRYDNYNLLERLGVQNVLTDEFQSCIDPKLPRTLRAEAYGETGADSLINRMLALDLRFQLADDDLPKVRRACELAGAEVGFPMLDDRMVGFSARLAPRLKLKGMKLRYFFKEALRDFLPREILVKKKHGFGLPFGAWLQSHKPLQSIALDSLSDLKKRGIVRPGFVDELTSVYVPQHPAYYGTMVWVLMMLEQWFQVSRIAREGR